MKFFDFDKNDKFSCQIILGLFVIVLLTLAIVLGVSFIDHFLEKPLYMGSAVWLLEKSVHPTIYLLFYSLPKALLIFTGVILLLKVFHNLKKKKAQRAGQYVLSVLAIGVIPAVISYLKNISMVPCPYNLLEFGGTEEAHSVMYYLLHRSADAGMCFPAGHASGGFALIGLIFLVRNHREAIAVVVLSTLAGLSMGFYQQARGAHFLSHTLATQAISLGFILIFFQIFYRSKKIVS